MRAMTLLALALLLIGVVGLLWGGISYVKDQQTADLGPLQVTAQQKERVPIPPAVAGGALVAGAALLIWDRRRGA